MVTKYQNVYVPDFLLQPCSKTEWKGGTYRGVGSLAASRGADLDDCNAQLKAARDYQEDIRSKEAGSPGQK